MLLLATAAPSSDDDDESDFSDLESASDSGEPILTDAQQRELDALTSTVKTALKDKQTTVAALEKKQKAAGAKKEKSPRSHPYADRGVVYIGHLPHGFTERPMRKFFSQFGDILNLRVSRNRVTGKSKHYAFIEFVNREIAEIVADAMHRYMMFGHTLIVEVMEPEKVTQATHTHTCCHAQHNLHSVPALCVNCRALAIAPCYLLLLCFTVHRFALPSCYICALLRSTPICL